MSKLTHLKLKQQAITEWWAVRQIKRLHLDEGTSKIICILVVIAVIAFVTLAQLYAIFTRVPMTPSVM